MTDLAMNVETEVRRERRSVRETMCFDTTEGFVVGAPVTPCPNIEGRRRPTRQARLTSVQDKQGWQKVSARVPIPYGYTIRLVKEVTAKNATRIASLILYRLS